MRLALFSISYAGLWGQAVLSVREFIEQAARLGFAGVMLAGKRPHLAPLDVTPAKTEEIREVLARTGLRCEVIAGYTDFAGGPAAEVPYGEMQVAYVEALARLAAAFQCGIVRVFTAYEHVGQSLTALWPRVVALLQECCDRAAGHGVTIALQNHHDLGVHTTALLELLADVDRPNCKLGFDAWSPALRGEDLYEAARRAAPIPFSPPTPTTSACRASSTSPPWSTTSPRFPTWCGPCLSARVPSTTALFSAAWSRAALQELPPTKCVRPCGAAAAWTTSTAVPHAT